VHLKSLHDAGTKTRFVVSGSANAALGMGSRESGAGRFTDFLLPPLTFAEFLNLRDLPSLYGISDMRELNRLFTMLALNTGNEISLDALASKSAVSKNTLKRYTICQKSLRRSIPPEAFDCCGSHPQLFGFVMEIRSKLVAACPNGKNFEPPRRKDAKLGL
jgi:predicted AAA+ superfamily ATPase